MSENNHTGHGRSGRGYYIALILCAVAVGITSYVYSHYTAEEEILLQEENVIPVGTMAQREDIPVIATQAPEQKNESRETEQTEPATAPKQKRKICSPVSGQEIFGYSMEALSYNQTTRDWRVHNGMDIAAEEGTEVVAAADGEVYTIYEDDTMGTTVVIRHKNGYTTRYSSLSENLQVQVGQSVKMGQVIGTVGATALVESVLGPHVHFSVTHQDVLMDPMEFLKMQ